MLFLWMPWPLLAQPAPAQREAQLAETTGEARLALLVDLTKAYQDDEHAKALAYGAEALGLLASFPDAARELELSLLLADLYFQRQEHEPAVQHGIRAVALARAGADEPALAHALHTLGGANRYQDKYEIALPLLAEAYALYEERGDLMGMGNVLEDVGRIHMGRGDLPLALDNFLRSHAHFEQTGNRAAMAMALNSVGYAHTKLTQFDLAFTYLQEALAIEEELGNDEEIGMILNTIGVNYHDQDKVEEALDYYQRSLVIMEKLGNKQSIARRHINIGNVNRELGHLDVAEDHLQKALQIRTEIGERGGVATALGGLGVVYQRRGDYARALDHLNRAIAIAEEVGEVNKTRRFLGYLSVTYEEMGRYRDALATFKRYDAISSQLFTEENSRTLAEMQARFEASQKQQQIEILQQQQQLDTLEIKRQRIIAAMLLAGLALLAVVLVLFVNRYRLKARSALLIAGSEQRYHRLFDDPSTAKLLLDPRSDTVLEANATVEALLAEPVRALVGKVGAARSFEVLRPVLDRLKEREAMNAPQSFVEVFAQRNGTVRDLEAWVSRIELKDHPAVLVTLLDVTERRRLEEERIRSEEREHYIALLEAQKAEVEARNAEMERFTYTISHELKSPLVTIQGFTGLLQQAATAQDTEREQHYLGRIATAAATMHRMLQELLDLSRVGRVVNPPEAVPLDVLVPEALGLLAGPIEAHTVAVTLAPGLPVVWGDRMRLREVIQNLVENAIKFMGDQPAPRIDIGACLRGDEVECFIRDNGIGIEPKFQDAIFGLFDRLDPGGEGTGVGLALVKRIVEVQGGRIWVESGGLGQGSTFFFTVPHHTA